MVRGRKSPVVHVVAYRKSADSPIQLLVTPDPLDMTQYAKGDHLITWKIDTLGYHFSISPEKPAIEFTSSGWEKSFRDLEVARGGRRATMHNKNVDGLAFAYNVNVVETKTGHQAFLDPVVQNQAQ